MATVEHNADGSCIITLSTPVTVGGEKVARVTVPRLTGRHLFRMPAISQDASIGVIVEWATTVVTPRGAVEEMDPTDAIAVASALLDSLGKSRPTGAQPSP